MQTSGHILPFVCVCVCVCVCLCVCLCERTLTGVDEELIGNSGVVDIMDSCSEQSSEDLQVGEDGLKGTKRVEEERKDQRKRAISII